MKTGSPKNSFKSLGQKRITQVINLDDCEITISEAKLENILIKQKAAFHDASDWKTPLSLIVAIVLVLLTADFKANFLGIGGEDCLIFFCLVLVCCFVWLIDGLVRKFKNRKQTIESIIKKIKNND